MGPRTVEYLIALRDMFSAHAQKIMQSSKGAQASINAMGQSANKTEAQLNKMAARMGAASQATAKAAQATKTASAASAEFVKNLGLQATAADRAANAAARLAAAQRVAGAHAQRAAYLAANQPQPPPIVAAGGKGERYLKGLHRGMGLHALAGMGHNQVFENWLGFDEQMRLVRGTLAGQISESQLKDLRSAALRMSKHSIFSPEDIAEIYVKQASSGIEPKDMIRIASQMIGLSTGTGEDPVKTFDTHLKIARGFELPLTEFPHISDMIARVHQKTGIQLNEILTQMGHLSAFAHAAGWTPEQTIGAVGYLSKRGMGPLAGTGLSRIISKSINWSKPAAEFWGGLGIKQQELKDKKTGGMIGPEAIIDLLHERVKKMPAFKVIGAFNKMFGDRGQRVAAAFGLSSSKELRTLIDDLRTSFGLAERVGEEGMEGASAAVKRLTAAWKGLHTAIGEAGLGETLTKLATKTSDILDWLNGTTVVGKGSRGRGTSTKTTFNHPQLLQFFGVLAAAGDVLAKMAMPLLALSILGPAMTNFVGGLGRISLKAAGLMRAADAMTLLGRAARGIAGITGLAAALAVGAAIVQNWDHLAGVVERVATAIQKIWNGDWKGGGKDLVKEAQNAYTDLDNRFREAHPQYGGAGTIGYLREDDGRRAATDFKTWLTNPRPINSSGRMGVAAENAARATEVAAQKIEIESRVKTTLDPIIVRGEPLTVNVRGSVDGGIQGQGTTPLNATAPRGRTMAEPAAPPVKR